jgi:hypothetical protein
MAWHIGHCSQRSVIVPAFASVTVRSAFPHCGHRTFASGSRPKIVPARSQRVLMSEGIGTL